MTLASLSPSFAFFGFACMTLCQGRSVSTVLSCVKSRQDFDIIVSGLTEETDYPYIYCYAEDACGLGIDRCCSWTLPLAWLFLCRG